MTTVGTNDDLNDSLDDLLGGKIIGPAKAPPEHYKPKDFSEPWIGASGSG